jgi:hypothetical protein
MINVSSRKKSFFCPKSHLLLALLATFFYLGPSESFCEKAKHGLGSDRAASDYELKALFFLRLTQFIRWPETVFSASAGALERTHLCVLGENPFSLTLERLLLLEDPKSSLYYLADVSSGHVNSDCHILFIGRNESHNLEQIISSVKKDFIVTVSDIAGFARRGGNIELLVAGEMIRFIVNLKQAKERGIEIDARLLSLAFETLSE